jgi:Fe-S-cluster-containing hydrogenase component 2
MKKILAVTPSKCIDCKKCQVACSYRNHQSYVEERARVRVVTQGEEDGIPVVCLQCEEAACKAVCPTGALKEHNELGVIDLDEDKCIRCRACVAACPFGNITYDEPSNQVQKCDLCKGEPMCAVFCPTGAMAYVDAPDEGYNV